MPTFGMKNGKFVMTPGGKWSSECGCIYAPSDGSLYSDDFNGALDPGWVPSPGSAWATSAGRLQETLGTTGVKFVRRTHNNGTDIINDLIVEANLYRLPPADRLGITIESNGVIQWIQNTTVTGGISTNHEWIVPGASGFVQAIRNDGDKLTIRLRRTGTNTYRGCFFLNETLLHEQPSFPWTPGQLLEHGLLLNRIPSTPAGEFDDYTIQIETTILGTVRARGFVRASSQYFNHGDIGNLTGDFTVATTVYLDSKANDQTIISKWSGAPPRPFQIYYDTSSDRFEMAYDNFGSVSQSAPAPSTGTWYALVGEYDSTAETMQLWVNDVAGSQATGLTTIMTDTRPLYVGALEDAGPTRYLDGRQAAANVWTRKLTAAEKTWWANDGKGRVYNELGKTGDGSNLLTGLLMSANLDETSGDALDSSGNNNTGTAVNAPGSVAGPAA